MMGMVESFNVSVAAAIILAEAQRQRSESNMYDASRMDAALYEKTLFEWAQPEITRFCRDRRLDYPELGEDGEVVELSQWYQTVRAEREARGGWPKMDSAEIPS